MTNRQDGSLDTPPSTNRPHAQFEASIARNTRYLVGLLQESPGRLSANQREHALRGLHFALQLREEWATSRSLLLALAPVLERAGYREAWIPFLLRGIRESERTGDGHTEARCQLYLGILYQLGGDYADASHRLGESESVFAALGDRRGQAEALSRRAYVAQLEQRYADAGQLIRDAEKLLAPGQPEWAYCALVKGTVAHAQGAWGDAVQWFDAARQAYEEQDNRRLLAWSLNNLGTAYRGWSRYEEAEACYEEAVSHLAALDDPVHLAAVQMNLGNLYVLTGRPEKALGCYQQAEPVFRRVRDRLRTAMLHNNLGKALRDLRSCEQAEAQYQVSIELYRELALTRHLADTLDGLGMLYAEQGLSDRAGTVFREALTLLDTLAPDAAVDALKATICGHLEAFCAAP